MTMVANNNDDSSPLHLGFCESIQHSEEIAHCSPDWSNWDGGQVGGRPSWLNPRHLPQVPLCRSNKACNSPLHFIGQLYAPADTVNPHAFHRTLYVWGCPTCSSVRVLRTQLARENDYYPSDSTSPPSTWNKHLPETYNVKICKVCGQRGKGVCPLQRESFCGKHHQKLYKACVFDKQPDEKEPLPCVYPMYEVVVEEEPMGGDDNHDENRETLFDANDDDDDSDQDLEQDDLNAMSGARNNSTNRGTTTDEFFSRVARAKDQCVRYHQWQDDAPLWLSSKHQPPSIPDCSYCGAPRKFEFQLMPQLLHYLKQQESIQSTTALSQQQKEALLAASTIVEKTDPSQIPSDFKETHEQAIHNAQKQLLRNSKNELDWGVVVVYTCTASCGGSDECAEDDELGAYREEYAWVQPSLG